MEREEGFDGSVGGSEEDIAVDAGVEVWGLAVVEVADPEARASNQIYQYAVLGCVLCDGSPGHLPAPFALSQGLGGDTAAIRARSVQVSNGYLDRFLYF